MSSILKEPILCSDYTYLNDFTYLFFSSSPLISSLRAGGVKTDVSYYDYLFMELERFPPDIAD
jgi:hypothetical protein